MPSVLFHVDVIKHDNKSSLGKEGLIRSKFKVTVLMAGKSRKWELEAVGHGTCVVRREYTC